MKEGYHTPQNLQADKTSELQACVTLQGKGRMTLSAEQSSAQSQGAEPFFRTGEAPSCNGV